MPEFQLKDSGERRMFDSGAQRDRAAGKGRFDLISPIALKRVALIPCPSYDKKTALNVSVESILNFLEGHRDHDYLAKAARNLLFVVEPEYYENETGYTSLRVESIKRLAIIFELGCKKYSERNWEKGMPFSIYIDSALRHAFQFISNYTDEDHAIQSGWNVMALIHIEEMVFRGLLPEELNDLPNYVKKTT